MSLKLSIVSSRKIGQPNFGSRGAVVGLDLEVDPTLLNHPRQLQHRIAKLFELAKQAVDCELTRSERAGCDRCPDNAQAREHARLATARQIRAIYAIANRHLIDLPVELRNRLGVSRPEDLTRDEASEVIAALGSFSQHSDSLDEPVSLAPPASS